VAQVLAMDTLCPFQTKGFLLPLPLLPVLLPINHPLHQILSTFLSLSLSLSLSLTSFISHGESNVKILLKTEIPIFKWSMIHKRNCIYIFFLYMWNERESLEE